MALHLNQLKKDKSIEQIAAMADLFPGVMLIHHIEDGSVAWISKQGLQQLDATYLLIKHI